MSRPKRQKTDTKMSPAVEVVQKPEITDTLLRDDRNGELMKLKLRNKGLPAQDRSWLWTMAETYSTDFEKLRSGTRLVSNSVFTPRDVCSLWQLDSFSHFPKCTTGTVCFSCDVEYQDGTCSSGPQYNEIYQR